MRKTIFFVAILFLLTTLFTQSASFANNKSWRDKVDGWVLETAVPANMPSTQNSYPKTEFLVQLQTQADLSGAELLPTKEEKGRFVYEQLTAVANRTQPAVMQELDALGVAYKPFWVSNMIWVEGDIFAVQAMALRDDVAHLYANPTVTQLFEPTLPQSVEGDVDPWDNIGHVGAKDVWALGYTGQGVVIGGQDTGYKWDHPALQNAYRGWDGGSAEHNYNWHDAWWDSFPCPSQAPCDDNSHGTHTMGTMVGALHDIGMAPGAKWIGCRNMHSGIGTSASYAACYQWFIAPTDLDGLNADPSKAPDVINNSWGCPTFETGCEDTSVLAPVVASVRAAGIVTVHSAGNDGPNCGSSNTPGTIYDESFSVGATHSNDQIWVLSSRGPITVDGSNRMKPDISAPGVQIYSATLGDAYEFKSGTSMAAPHVAGLVALILSARPDLKGNVDAIEQMIQATAVKLTTSQGCDTDTSTSIPNNVYGYGRINAHLAIILLTTDNKIYIPLMLK